MPWWEDLSDDELRARLTHGGVGANETVALVHHRDDPWAAEQITEKIDR